MIILGVDNPPAITKTNTISRRSVYCGSSNKRLGHGPGCSGSKVVSPIIQVVLVFSTIYYQLRKREKFHEGLW